MLKIYLIYIIILLILTYHLFVLDIDNRNVTAIMRVLFIFVILIFTIMFDLLYYLNNKIENIKQARITEYFKKLN
jgi:hypothetical protein